MSVSNGSFNSSAPARNSAYRPVSLSFTFWSPIIWATNMARQMWLTSVWVNSGITAKKPALAVPHKNAWWTWRHTLQIVNRLLGSLFWWLLS